MDADGSPVVIELATLPRKVQNSKRPVPWCGIRVYGVQDARSQVLHTFWEQVHYRDCVLPEIHEKIRELENGAVPAEDVVGELEGFLEEFPCPPASTPWGEYEFGANRS